MEGFLAIFFYYKNVLLSLIQSNRVRNFVGREPFYKHFVENGAAPTKRLLRFDDNQGPGTQVMLEPLSNTQVMFEAPSSTQVTTRNLKGFLGVVDR